MHHNTNFDSIYTLFENADIKAQTQEEFNNLDETILNEAIIRFTDFDSWEEFLNEAGVTYLQNNLFKGVKL